MNGIQLLNLISTSNINVISVNYLHVNKTIYFTNYQILGTIFYFFNENEGVSLDLTHYETHNVQNNVLNIKLSKLYQERFIQLFDDSDEHIGQLSFSGFNLMSMRYHKLNAMELMINDKDYVLHVSQIVLNSAGVMIYLEPDQLSVIVPMYMIEEIYSIDTYKIIMRTL
ncbi:hypothetical protein AN639_04230 [Candidatus Epulonipiscium fishelsonii]|uniref:Uncharacterized protein n=1 Tax=Candidatus Epulonipiscium fishelsonii TaxID=77094 RepID=A0ACC8XFF5_9FIRM|nr:hypothetical protein AN639_04230 [Epulopiscium sp. SCG-B05WGA-EpuloA1]ONI42114.1 hypothetical protein AN396_02490 [Epulopiscium sp. SCG-B11WGA-EpuloA1]ONI47267.1 hypothetical protein AN644_00950 [Epulopiscium sp. SCG-C06WGA-EpuloA1]